MLLYCQLDMFVPWAFWDNGNRTRGTDAHFEQTSDNETVWTMLSFSVRWLPKAFDLMIQDSLVCAAHLSTCVLVLTRLIFWRCILVEKNWSQHISHSVCWVRCGVGVHATFLDANALVSLQGFSALVPLPRYISEDERLSETFTTSHGIRVGAKRTITSYLCH